MNNIINSIYNMGLIDELSKKNTFIHKLHPLVKLLTTIFYLVTVLSFNKYEIIWLIPFVFYPVLIFSLGEIPVLAILKKLLFALPFILGIGIVNIFFDKDIVNIAGIYIYSGYLAFISVFIKYALTVIASILLIATTGIDRLCTALRMLKIPKVFILQFLLTYRYISILTEEVSTMSRAYLLRAPRQKGIHPKIWGSFAGQLLIRSYDRAERVYEAMVLRGFNGEYNTDGIEKMQLKDFLYLIIWSIGFIFSRCINIPNFIGSLF